jgi:ABC-type phosphate/phosphonate transport system substrate-binding protein
LRVRLAPLGLGLLLALVAGPIACSRQEPSLTLALSPSRDPTALKEAGDAFAKTITQISGVPIKVIVASDYAGVIGSSRRPTETTSRCATRWP